MSVSNNLKRLQAKIEFSSEKKQSLLEILSEFLSYGLSMHAIFDDLLPKLYEKGSLRLIIDDIAEKISQGVSLSDALSPWYGFKVAAILRSGEASDNIHEAMSLARESLSDGRSYISAFMKKITYSLIVFLASNGLVALFYFQVVPAFMGMLISQHKLVPGITSNFVHYGNFIFGVDSILILILLAACIIGVGLTLSFYTGNFRNQLDRLPLFGIYRQIVAADLLEQLGFYFKANILLDTAVGNILQGKPSRYLRMHGQRIIAHLEEGVDNITEAFDTGLFDKKLMAIMLAMGRINRFEAKCLDYAHRLQQETIARVTKAAGGVSLILMLVGAVNIIWSIGAMYLGVSAIQ